MSQKEREAEGDSSLTLDERRSLFPSTSIKQTFSYAAQFNGTAEVFDYYF